MKQSFIVALLFLSVLWPGVAQAENYLLNGGQESTISYQMVQSIETTPSTRKLVLTYVEPASFSSPTYNQQIKNLDITFSPKPDQRKQQTDPRGNALVEAVWNQPPQAVTTTISLTAVNTVKLDKLETSAPFPVQDIPPQVRPYLEATSQVQSTASAIKKKARELTASSKTEFDAIQQILTWLVDNMRYVQPPQAYDALYSFRTGQGNCQNYSHLAAALMRAAGIPVRIVNGITLKKSYNIKQSGGTLVMKNAQGRHSWIEVYLSDLKWLPLDPQQTELFVSNRFIRVEVGQDNLETENDGLIRWTRVKGTTTSPTFREEISADFVSDHSYISGRGLGYGPRNRLLGPEVVAEFKKTSSAPKKPEPVKLSPREIKNLVYSEPYVYGNLQFPENLDFQSTRPKVQQNLDGSLKIVKNFLVETAEYVTTKGQKYAQSFILNKPLRLSEIGLALHNFGSSGQLWVELFRDQEGLPRQLIATSDLTIASELPPGPGYQWVDFDFTDPELILAPGRYWLALGFTGGPIVNWFFSYGKPTGPQDGTRYRTLFDEKWSHSLSFEFNYRVSGLIPKEFKDL